MRVPQPEGKKGSLKWIQVLVNNQHGKLTAAIAERLTLSNLDIQWFSPLALDQYAEYRDGAFLDILGLGNHKGRLCEFWPRNGPQWDALGKVRGSGPYFLIEAKANIPEITSSLGAKSEHSIAQILKRLAETRQYLRCKNSDLWENGFYQYVNRLAHLHFLRNSCGVDAYLVFVYFLNDPTHMPTSLQQWTGALELQKTLLGIKNHLLKKFVAEAFIDTEKMAEE